MRLRRFSLALLVTLASAATTVTVDHTIRDQFGATYNGPLTISLSTPSGNASGARVLSVVKTLTIQAGVLSTTLAPNDAITPPGSAYIFEFGNGETETCIFPASPNPLTLDPYCAATSPTIPTYFSRTGNAATSVSASNLGYSGRGTATASTVQAKLQQYIDVRDFGVKCDGSTDDTPALQAAADAFATTPIVFHFPSGTCKLSGELLVYSGQTFEGAGGMNFVSGQTMLQRSGTSASPVFGPHNRGADTQNVIVRNIAFDGGLNANPVIDWYRISTGRLDGVYVTGAATGVNGIVVDANISNQAYFNIFSQVNIDSVSGCGILFQNGANVNQVSGGRAIWSGKATSTCGAIKFTSGSSGNSVYGFDAEGSDVVGSKPSQLYYVDASYNSFYGVHGENGAIGFLVTNTATGSHFSGTSFASTVTTATSCATALLCAVSTVNEFYNPTGSWDNSAGYLRSSGNSTSTVSAHYFDLLTQNNTAASYYNFGHSVRTTAPLRTRFWNGSGSISAQINHLDGSWIGNGNLYGNSYRSILGSTGDTANAAAQIGTYGLSVSVRNNPSVTSVDIDPVLQAGNAITGSTLHSGGTGYVVDETGFLIGPASSKATFTVNSVNSAGAVLTYTLSTPGTGYIVRNGYLTESTSGRGQGLTINVTSVSASTSSAAVSFFNNMTGSGSRTFKVNGLPSSAGGGGLYVCADSAGQFYLKSSCP